MKITPAISLSLLLLLPSAQARLQVMADLGGEPTAPLYQSFVGEYTPPATPPAITAPSPDQATGFPVRSPSLSPGRPDERSLHTPGLMPLFLVGSDRLSVEWLIRNQEPLARLNATGFVVNVESLAQFADLQKQFPHITLIPASGEDIAQRLQLRHYPVLLTENGLSQQVTP